MRHVMELMHVAPGLATGGIGKSACNVQLASVSVNIERKICSFDLQWNCFLHWYNVSLHCCLTR